ncbi:hypothetical protein [Methylobacterium sp. Leaf93]|uniref:hypothetical protein n=1 Tax=Methylobacterium sp. Leaf93 TaxID=1736249 RepID=UPI001FCDC397|nr:hypothetical protein [Methylobacterium sp. Leaf93]
MNELATAARGRSMTDDEQRDFDAAASQVTSLDAKIATAEAEKDRTSTTSIDRTDASQIARLCVEGGVPNMAATLLAEGVSLDDAKKRIGAAGEAQKLVALARRKDASIPEDLAATMLADGKSVEQVRAALFDKLVAGEERTSISSHVPAAIPAGPTASANSMERELKRAGLKKDA